MFFVPALVRRLTRNLAVVLAIVVNAFFGIVLATPWSSLVVIAVTGIFLSDDRWEDVGFFIGDLTAPITDRLIDGWYAVVDKVEDWWFRYVLAAVDWIRFTVFRR